MDGEMVEVASSPQRNMTLLLFTDGWFHPHQNLRRFWPANRPIEGRLQLDVRKPVEVLSVSVSLSGTVSVKFPVTTGRGAEHDYFISKEQELFPSVNCTLLDSSEQLRPPSDSDSGSGTGSGSGNNDSARSGLLPPKKPLILQPGTYSYPFVITPPPAYSGQLPTHCTLNTLGRIAYTLTAAVRIPGMTDAAILLPVIFCDPRDIIAPSPAADSLRPPATAATAASSSAAAASTAATAATARAVHALHRVCGWGHAGRVLMQMTVEQPTLVMQRGEKRRVTVWVGAAAATAKRLNRITVTIHANSTFRAHGKSLHIPYKVATHTVKQAGMLMVCKDGEPTAEAAADAAARASAAGAAILHLPPTAAAALGSTTPLPAIPITFDVELLVPSVDTPLMTIAYTATCHLHSDWSRGPESPDVVVPLYVKPSFLKPSLQQQQKQQPSSADTATASGSSSSSATSSSVMNPLQAVTVTVTSQ